MIADVIVIATVVFAGFYSLLWCLKKDWRTRIEAPKLIFQQQLQAYDAGSSGQASPPDPHSDALLSGVVSNSTGD